MSRLIFISDTHLTEPKLPKGDILIHCGDLTYNGSIEQVTRALKWLGKQDFEEILLTPGNHDWLFEREQDKARTLCEENNINLLIDQAVVIDGIKFYGSPHQPEFCNWAYNLPRGQALKEKWDLIPDDTNVLITHSPPYMMLDYAPQCGNVGCVDLWNRVIQLKELKIHAFGHIHFSGNMVKEFMGIKFLNSSICCENYRPSNQPISIDYE